MADWSSSRLYIGNLPKDVTKVELQELFEENGHGKITEIKLMDGFGFIQYENPADARDIVPTMHGKEFKGQQLIVQFARGNRHHNTNHREYPTTGYPTRPRRTPHRMLITGLPLETSWQDLKDFARKSNDNVVYSDMGRDGRGTVEFETLDDLKRACSFLDGQNFRGYTVTCVADDAPSTSGGSGGRGYGGGGYGGPPRGRSVSPYRGGGYGRRYSPGQGGRHSGNSPPPRYNSRRYDDDREPQSRGYRERSPPPRRGGHDPYYPSSHTRSPPRRPPPSDPYPPARPPASDYDRPDYPPPRRSGAYDDGYGPRNGARGHRYDDTRRYSPEPPRGAGRPSPPPRGPPPPREEYYDRRY